MQVDLIDNKGNNTLAEVLKKELKKGSKISVASASFSLHIFQELKKALEKGDSFRFLYTESTFYEQEIDQNKQIKIIEKKGEFLQLEGNQYEIPLRNQMRSKQMAIELSKWLKEYAEFKTILGNVAYPKQIMIHNESDEDVFIQSEISFTADGLGITPSNRQASYTVIKENTGLTKNMLSEFNRIWEDETKSKTITEEILQKIESFYKENTAE